MQAMPGFIEPDPWLPLFQVRLLVQTGAALNGSLTTPPSPAPPSGAPQVPPGYPALIQFWMVVTSDAGARVAGAGGIGDVVLCMRATDTCASVIAGLAFDGAVRSAYDTSDTGTPWAGTLP